AEGGRKGRLSDPVRLLGDPKRLWREHRRLVVALVLGMLALAAGVVIAYELLKRPPDVHNPDVTFVPQKPPKPQAKTVNWPIFGLDPARTRYLPAKGVKPPFRKLWRFTERPLLEFPPVYAGGKLYFVNNSGYAFALDADTGKVLWERRIGRLNASSPAYHRQRLYIVNLVPGHILKLDAKTGKTIWKRSLPSRAESSPLVIGRTVYFGCEDGGLYALSTISGNVRWATSLGGPVKSAPAYYRDTLYVGDYGGYMNAVDADSGELRWQSGSLGQGFGTSGAFYSTPAVAFGRVYAGNNDDRVYSFDRKDGTLAWSYSTGGYAYSGPTVANTRHSPPTVYIGSFDGNVYALDAKDGSLRWSRSAGGQVIGSLSAIGNIVYAAEFTDNSTSGFMMRSGRRVFHYGRGTYSPVISDGRRIYLTGYSSITALQPYKYKRAVAPAIVAPAPKKKATRGKGGKPRKKAGAKKRR
ncbi:MAG TPA: PQQ-binding-like beta-propeller repeat protein, partial [Solirubrobacterales bacterium]|nr:PQQ-binding-like beta-propeller repeat protein [Solirubrobacterales bacterium]